MRSFKQVDVFTAVPYLGNALAVVLDGVGLSTEQMQRFANWTNLSETTFLLPPEDQAADYRVRIFTRSAELPFAGHPTIGSCHAWLEAGGTPKAVETIVQECGAGLVPLRRTEGRLSFAAPPLIRDGIPTDDEIDVVAAVLAIDRTEIVDAKWADNGPGWIAVRLESAEAVLALTPDFSAAEHFEIGVVGLTKAGVAGLSQGEAAVEVRAFFADGQTAVEDPVTGSLNASLAQWMLGSGVLKSPYFASQGTALGRAGRVYIEEADGEIWVGGDVVTCIDGAVALDES